VTSAAPTRDDVATDSLAIDTTVAHAARIEAFHLGVNAYFEADRIAAEHVASVHPRGIEIARASALAHRAFLALVVGWLARERGVRQFVTVGSGISGGDGLHAVAQRVVPEARVVYVDDDPLVLAHAHQLQGTSTHEGRVRCLQGDLRQPGSILVRAAEILDFAAPVGMLLAGSLHNLPDSDDGKDPVRVVRRLMDVAPSGSYLALCHLAIDIHPAEMVEVARRLNETTAQTWVLRDREQVGGFFDRLELVEPGVVELDQWHPEGQPAPVPAPDGHNSPLWVGVGRKP
jgi:hypothetical protein